MPLFWTFPPMFFPLTLKATLGSQPHQQQPALQTLALGTYLMHARSHQVWK